jgi:hypothetical protein
MAVWSIMPYAWLGSALARGDVPEARRVLSRFSHYADSADVQDRAGYLSSHALVLRAEGDDEGALGAAQEALADIDLFGPLTSSDAKVALVEALESSLALGRLSEVESFIQRIESIPPGQRPPFLRAQAARFRARLARATGLPDQVQPGFKTAAAILREYGLPFELAIVLLEHGEWLMSQGRADEAAPLLTEAREVFARLEATPWLERTTQASPAAREPEAVSQRA